MNEQSEFLKRIEELTFYDCIELREIDIPNSVRVIDSWAFWHCNSLQELKLPTSLVTIGINTFPYTMKTISIDSKNKRYTVVDGVLYNKDMTELVLVPMSLDIREFIVPTTVKKIKKNALHHLYSVLFYTQIRRCL